MTSSNIFSTNFKTRNRDHFASIVRIALSDNIINKEERKFINRLAILLEIDEKEVQEIIENPESYEINPPSTEKKRLERLYDLSRIVLADEIADNKELELLKRFALSLGFSSDSIEKTVSKAIQLIQKGVDEDDFISSFN
tara:strand:+ start:1691 stop:2110 length:420 start_codon:yes stop_codon:yes gene_type:complete